MGRLHGRNGAKVVSKRAKKSRLHFIGTGERVKGAALKEAWNSRLSVAQNYANLGLAKNINATSSGLSRSSAAGASAAAPHAIFAEVPRRTVAEQLRARAQKAASIPEETAEYVAPLIKKYGANYAKMRNDIKLNRKQMNSGWLKKNCEKYLFVQAAKAAAAAEEDDEEVEESDDE